MGLTIQPFFYSSPSSHCELRVMWKYLILLRQQAQELLQES